MSRNGDYVMSRVVGVDDLDDCYLYLRVCDAHDEYGTLVILAPLMDGRWQNIQKERFSLRTVMVNVIKHIAVIGEWK